ncbi:MAG: Gfo/Idh/MocA family oxidoreductase [Coriobacteriales bacterium]|nr:Gfo/Idh/MocA family oxidoreductase [Coriobacteriales bacterium]
MVSTTSVHEPIKVAVIGVGSMGRNHLRVLSELRGFDLVGCFDVNREAAAEQAARYGIAAFDSVEALYAATEAVTVVVPSSLHAQYAVAAAKSGCHVFVEKPIALTLDEADAIIDACAACGVKLMVGHIERFNPAIVALRDVIRDEEAIALRFQRLSPYFERINDASVVEDLMIHDIDILNSLVTSPIAEIQAQGAKVFTDRLDFAETLIRFESGQLASLTASRVTQMKIRRASVTSRTAYVTADYLTHSVEVTRKTNFSEDRGASAQYAQESTVESVVVPLKEPLRAEFECFAEAVRADGPVHTDGASARRALETCLEIKEICRGG